MKSQLVRDRRFTAIFGLTISLSAFLLFQIQPMIGRFILPWFGGSSAVWTTSMLFFQLLLLGGYAYAHILSGLAPRRQALLHALALLAVAGWFAAAAFERGAPIFPSPGLMPDGGEPPIWRILIVLAVSVGVPYLLLSTTSSLLQSWYRVARRRGSPYAFYALSNAASLLALLTYPLIFEPWLALREQALFWSAGFAAYLALAALCAALLRAGAGEMALGLAAADPAGEVQPAEENGPRPGWRLYLAWVGLAAISSTLLLATTNHVTQDLSSAPFLWVLPLGLYLLSFVIAFDDRQAGGLRGAYILLTLSALLLGFFNLDRASNMPILLQIVSNAALLLIICLFCHTELYARRPHPRYLTGFYLMVSIGGALGGLFVGLFAPLVFTDFWEYPLGLAAAGLAAGAVAFQARGEWIHRLRFPVALAALALVVAVFSTSAYWLSGSSFMTRSFYGVLRVRPQTVEGQPGFRLMHGGILHGSQVQGAPYSTRPTTYYTQSSGVGLAYRQHPKYLAGAPMRVGVVGLGVGTLAAYGRPGDVIRFYEINPEVVRLARDPRFFSYLAESQADVDVVIGDARLSMERELAAGSQGYDLLVVDAFSGDSIPTHLLNRESFAIYLSHLAPGGVLAVHISNRHIDLQPVVAALAEQYAQESTLIEGGGADWQGSYSVWALVGSGGAVSDNPPFAGRALRGQPGLRIWTDDYSNLIQVLRR